MHSEIRHEVTVVRDGEPVSVEVTHLVPGDIVHLGVGSIVPADVRLLAASNLECDESILTGESVPAEKSAEPVASGAPLGGAVVVPVHGHGRARGLGRRRGRGHRAPRRSSGGSPSGSGERQPQTEFQLGLTRFSGLLAKVGGVLSVTIFVINVAPAAGRCIDAVLFSLAVAVGHHPAAAAGGRLDQPGHRVAAARREEGARQAAGVHRGPRRHRRAVHRQDRHPHRRPHQLRTGDRPDRRRQRPTCSRSAWSATRPPSTDGHGGRRQPARRRPVGGTRRGRQPDRRVPPGRHRPFDHDRRCVSVLVDHDGQRLLITKGAPEAVLDRCTDVADEARRVLDAEFAAGNRVVAVASRPAPELDRDRRRRRARPDTSPASSCSSTSPSRRRPRRSPGSPSSASPSRSSPATTPSSPRPSAATLGVDVGRHAHRHRPRRPRRRRSSPPRSTDATIFARVSPEQKARILRAQRDAGSAVAFLGDGVNDALALHHADVGISVDSATDVAKDAADIILLERDLDVLADGVVEGRRIFANTIKYVLMGTSSNFGNMFSVTVAAAFLPFLPMLPSQILLNNLLYDTSQMTIPTDRVDEEQLARPSHWDIGFIRRFMIRFGPISSIFDFATFAVMLWVFDAGAPAVPLRLVRRVARHPDPRRVRHPHPAGPVLPEPTVAAAARLGDRRRDDRRPDPPEPAQRHARVRAAPARRSSPCSSRFVVAYLAARRGRQVLLLQDRHPHHRPAPPARPRPPRPPSRRPLEPPPVTAPIRDECLPTGSARFARFSKVLCGKGFARSSCRRKPVDKPGDGPSVRSSVRRIRRATGTAPTPPARWSRARGEVAEDRPHLLRQYGQLTYDHLPDDDGVHVPVAMGQQVSHVDDLTPGDLRVTVPEPF